MINILIAASSDDGGLGCIMDCLGAVRNRDLRSRATLSSINLRTLSKVLSHPENTDEKSQETASAVLVAFDPTTLDKLACNEVTNELRNGSNRLMNTLLSAVRRSSTYVSCSIR